MRVPFSFPYAFRSGTERQTREVLLCLRACLVTLNQGYHYGVVYRLERTPNGVSLVFDCASLFERDSNPVDNAFCLKALLEFLIDCNRVYLRAHAVPSLYNSGVRYGRTTEWEPIPALYTRKMGDCKSLTAALVAEYRNAGKTAEPVFRFKELPNKTLYHILVEVDEGYQDPSKVLGMTQNENRYFTKG